MSSTGTTQAQDRPQVAADEPRVKLDLRSVVKTFGEVEAVKNISLAVEEGLFLTILGPSGSGKTTLLRMIAGFMPVTSGSIWLGGVDISSLPPGKREIGMVFQNYALFPHMTARDNILYPLRMRKWSKERQKARTEEVLALVGMEHLGDRFPRQLSGGQQQRIALARSLSFMPNLLLMDEPLGALDRELRVRMAGELRRLHEELGNTVLYVTHDREEALTLSDRIAVMRDGDVESVGRPQDLFARPETAFVASFFGGHNIVPCSSVSDVQAGTVRVSCLGLDLTVPASTRLDVSQPVSLAVPGDALELADASAARDCIAASVHSAVYMGNHIHVACDVGIDDVPQLRMDLPGGRAMPPPAGSRVALRIDAQMVTAVNKS